MNSNEKIYLMNWNLLNKKKEKKVLFKLEFTCFFRPRFCKNYFSFQRGTNVVSSQLFQRVFVMSLEKNKNFFWLKNTVLQKALVQFPSKNVSTDIFLCF